MNYKQMDIVLLIKKMVDIGRNSIVDRTKLKPH